jgi:4-hydroxy-3-methylbut-2-en-1-yl diphosphate reductase
MPSYFVVQSIIEPQTASVGTRRIIRAAHLGMCFGVRDAIALAKARASEQPLTILGELVHNEAVMADLQARGIRSETQVSKIETSAVMVTAHGASEMARQRARARGLEVIEATCPLVHHAHRAVGRLVAEGFHPVIIGQRGHVEVRGLTEDLAAFDIILTEEDVNQLAPRPRFGVAAQTTEPIDRVRQLVECIRRRFPESEVRFIDTVCQPTKQRQSAALDLARESDVVVVVGGRHSNNTRELAESCRRFCGRVFHVQEACDLRTDWFESAQTIGLTAGTSTPDSVINEVEHWLRTNLESANDK